MERRKTRFIRVPSEIQIIIIDKGERVLDKGKGVYHLHETAQTDLQRKVTGSDRDHREDGRHLGGSLE